MVPGTVTRLKSLEALPERLRANTINTTLYDRNQATPGSFFSRKLSILLIPIVISNRKRKYIVVNGRASDSREQVVRGRDLGGGGREGEVKAGRARQT